MSALFIFLKNYLTKAELERYNYSALVTWCTMIIYTIISEGGSWMKVNFDISKPIYQQVIAEIQRSLVRGELEPGSKLPSQRDLAQKLKVNHNTIQRPIERWKEMVLWKLYVEWVHSSLRILRV